MELEAWATDGRLGLPAILDDLPIEHRRRVTKFEETGFRGVPGGDVPLPQLPPVLPTSLSLHRKAAAGACRLRLGAVEELANGPVTGEGLEPEE